MRSPDAYIGLPGGGVSPRSGASGKLASLEAIRAVAALLVVMFHAQTIVTQHTGQVLFSNAFAPGYRGVDLFFVLSGFIIATIHHEDLGRPDRLFGYAYNRLTRIFPAVFIVSLCSVLLYAMGAGGADRMAKLAPSAVVASFLLLPQQGVPLVNVTWTLTYELFFYALFGVAIANRALGFALLVIWQAAILCLASRDLAPGLSTYYFRPICLDFGVGLTCAWVIRHPGVQAWGRNRSLAVTVAGLASFLIGLGLEFHVSWAAVPCAVGAGALIVGLVRLEQSRHLTVPQSIVAIGGASYAIYLVHFSVITLAVSALTRRGVTMTDGVGAGCAAAGVGAGLVFNLMVDRPLQRWLRQWKAVLLHRQPPDSEHRLRKG